MSETAIRLSDLDGLTPEQRRVRFFQLAEARNVPLNGEVADLESRIKAFELRFEMSSARMRKLLAQGEISETAELGTWLMLLEARERLGK